jgi:hypothetical protein
MDGEVPVFMSSIISRSVAFRGGAHRVLVSVRMFTWVSILVNSWVFASYLWLEKIQGMLYNIPGVCHQLISEFELKHDMLSDDQKLWTKICEVVMKVSRLNLWVWAPNLNLDNTALLTYWPLSDIYLSNVEGAVLGLLKMVANRRWARRLDSVLIYMLLSEDVT